MDVFIRLVAHGQVQPGLFIYDTLFVGEGVKSGFPMISPHPAFPKAAEAHFAGGKVDDGVVDAAAAEAAAGRYPAGKCLIPGEYVERQRMGHGVEVADDLILGVVSEDRHDRPEDFLLHHGVCEGHVVHHRRLDLQGAAVDPPAADHLVRIDEPADPVIMLLIDDLSVVKIQKRRLAELLLDLAADLLDQPVLDCAVTVHIIRGDAGLPAVQIFSKDNPFGRQPDVGAALHNAGAFSAQLQGDGGEVSGRVLHDLFAHGLASGKENIVKMFVQQAGVFLPSPGNHRHVLFLEAFLQDRADDLAGMGGIRAGLDHRRIARRNGIHQGIKSQQEGVIPGTHDQYHPVGARLFIASGMKLRQRGPYPFFTGKRVDMPEHVSDLAEHQPGFTHIALEGTFSQILFQGKVDLGFIFFDACF